MQKFITNLVVRTAQATGLYVIFHDAVEVITMGNHLNGYSIIIITLIVGGEVVFRKFKISWKNGEENLQIEEKDSSKIKKDYPYLN